MRKSYLQRIFIGFKKGYQTPTLPDHIIEFTNKPLIRIMRVLGGISFLNILSKTYLNFPIFILYICFFFTLIFTLFHFYLTYHRLKFMIKTLKSGALEVINSPLDRLAFLVSKALYCLKGACDQAQPIGLGLMIGVDDILKNSDNEPIFTPFLGNLLNKVIDKKPITGTEQSVKNILETIRSNNENTKITRSILDHLKELNLSGDLTKDEFDEMRNIVVDKQDELKAKNSVIKSELKSKLSDIIDK